MIPIVRSSRPAHANDVRDEEIARIRREAADPDRPTRDELGKRYTSYRNALFLAQRKKCCYCETRWGVSDDYKDLEHFRPAIRAVRGPGFPDHGSWWLAWTWENLLFACPPCNRTAKNDQFPLDAGSGVLAIYEDPEGSEVAFLIDPAGPRHPMDHIRFDPMRDPAGKEKWIPRGLTDAGLRTIEILQLDSPLWVETYTDHVNEKINVDFKEFWNAVTMDKRDRVVRSWKGICDRFLDARGTRRPVV